MGHLDFAAVIRSALVFAHLFAFAAAAAAIAMGDFAIFYGRRVNSALLGKCASAVGFALLVLWITGLALVWLDTRFAFDVLAGRPKLLAKFNVVVFLTLNGFALSRFAFPRFAVRQGDPHGSAMVPAMLGAVSATTWIFAAFLGVARGLDDVLGYPEFMALYVLAVVLGIVVALRFVWPHLTRQMWRGNRTVEPEP